MYVKYIRVGIGEVDLVCFVATSRVTRANGSCPFHDLGGGGGKAGR